MFQTIPIAQIHPSELNPRKQFGDLSELAASIREKGVIEPLVLRPGTTDGYEIVAGERRYRAAKLAGLEELPAIVKELTPQEALELALIENCQREDLSQLEEAEGFMQLHELFGLSADEIAKRTGKSKATVYARMKLCNLMPDARSALADGRLTPSTALYIARLPTSLQAKALAKCAPGSDPLPARQVSATLQHEFMVRLEDAHFDVADEKLVPLVGSCTACPKRSGNARDLYPDVASADVCTEPSCFELKTDALYELRLEKARSKGYQILNAKQSAKLFAPWSGERLAHGVPYVDLADPCELDPERRSWKKLIGRVDGLAIVVARDPKVRPRELVTKDDANEALVKAGHPFAQKKADEKQKAKARDYSNDEEFRKKRELRERVLNLAAAEVAKAVAKKPSVSFWRELLRELVRYEFIVDEHFEKRHGLESATARTVENLAQSMDEPQLRGMVAELLFLQIESYGGDKAANAFASELGIDVKALEAKAKNPEALVDEKPAPAPKASPSKKAPAAKSKKPAKAKKSSKKRK